jgi:hypothetical protein
MYMTSFIEPSNNKYPSIRKMTSIASANVANTFKSVLGELCRNTTRTRHHVISKPTKRVSFYADADYLDKPAPAVTAIYTVRSATLIDSIKTKADQDAEDAAAFAALSSTTLRCWKPSRPRTKKIEQTDEDAFAELSFIPLFDDNLTNNK